MAYVIKRYGNRKLYDIQASRYVTLDDLEHMIRAGEEIAVVDAATGEDLTAIVLTQIILEHERGGHAALPAAFLHQLIKHGDAWQQFMAKGLYATLEGVIESQHEAERIFRVWAAGAGLRPSVEDQAAPDRGKRRRKPPAGKTRRGVRTRKKR
ncbi:MAG: polyhydroxyalkanoate synthesis regulator DNA-binding domain-containing protein [Armatimonadota bacterium]